MLKANDPDSYESYMAEKAKRLVKTEKDYYNLHVLTNRLEEVIGSFEASDARCDWDFAMIDLIELVECYRMFSKLNPKKIWEEGM
jgi:hypothetical protein